MNTEFEAKFYPVEKDGMRSILNTKGAKLVRPEFLQKRVTFDPPPGQDNDGKWYRVRDEGHRITMSYKEAGDGSISTQKELELTINDFNDGVSILENLGCIRKAYQETKRELWNIDGAEVTIDEWPWLEPFVEIEGESEAQVKQTAELLGFNYDEAIFGPVDRVYTRKYNVDKHIINHKTPEITFSTPNPFLEYLRK